MRFPLAAIFLIFALFVVFIGWAVLSYLMFVIEEQFTPLADLLTATSKGMFLGEISNINLGFGVATVILILLIIVVFVVDSLRQEPEQFYNYPGGR